jgi:hypothetical protein
MHVLTLEVYYRYLPLYKRGADGNAVKILEVTPTEPNSILRGFAMSRFFALAVLVPLTAAPGCFQRGEVKIAPAEKAEPAVGVKAPAEPPIDKVAPMPREVSERPEAAGLEVAPFPHEPADTGPGLVAP